MKRICISLFLLLSLFIFVGCQNKDDVTKGDTDLNKVKEKVTLEGAFLPPKFKVNKFEVAIDKKDIIYSIDYTLDSELYGKLERNDSEYFFQLKFPNEVFDILDKQNTEIEKGALIKKNKLNYTTEIKMKLPNDLANKDIKYLKNHKKGYGLYVLDYDKDPVQLYEDINLYSTTYK